MRREEEMSGCLGIFLQVCFTPYVPQIGRTWCQGKDMQPAMTIHSLAALHGGVTSIPFPPSGSMVQRRKEMRWKRLREGSLTDVEQFLGEKAVANIRVRERLSLLQRSLVGNT